MTFIHKTTSYFYEFYNNFLQPFAPYIWTCVSTRSTTDLSNEISCYNCQNTVCDSKNVQIYNLTNTKFIVQLR